MQKHYNYLDIDLDNKNNYRRLNAMQGDIKTRYILVNLYSNNLAYNLSNCTVKIYGLKRDKTIFFNNAVITNAKLGQFEIELTNQALAIAGELKIQILVLGTAGEKLTSSAFFIDVGESIIDENAIESANEFNVFTQAMKDFQKWDGKFKEKYDGLEAEYAENITELGSQIKDNTNEIEINKTNIDIERQRINNLSTLPEGSTKGDAELIDGRIDGVGFSYPNIGGNIRSFQEMIYNSGGLKIPCGEWENGIISTTSGNNSENDKTKFARIKEFIGVPVGTTLTFNVIASNGYIPKLTIYHYDQNKTFVKSQAVENKSVVMQYPYIKLCYFYESTPADINLNDAMATNITTKVQFNGLFEKIPQLNGLFERFDKIPSMVGSVNANKSIDFNDYKIGYYFISCSSSQAETYPLINAPFNAKWGYYELLSIPFTNEFSLQLAICSNGAKRGIFIRTYNTSTNVVQIDWKVIDSDLSRSFKQYIALGDSITWGHISGSGTESSPFIRADYPYPTTVANVLGLDVTYGAQTGCGWLQLSGNKTAISIVDSIDFSNYNLATLAFGRNDYNGNQPLGEKTDMYPTQKTILGAVNYCLKKIYTDSPMIDVVVITPLNEATKGNADSNYAYGTANSQGYTLKQLCTAIRELCEEKNVNYIDNSKGGINYYI